MALADGYWGTTAYSPTFGPWSAYTIQTPTFSPNFGTPGPITVSLPDVSTPGGSPYQIQTPSFSPNFGSPGTINVALPNISTEAVTVSASPAPYQIQTPSFSPAFMSPAISPAAITANLPALDTAAAAMPAESVTVPGYRTPEPTQVRTPVFSPYQFAVTPAMTQFPNLPGAMPPANQNTQRQVRAQSGGGGGGGASPKMPQPQPAAFKPQPIQPPQGVTQQQMNALGNLTPAQLRALLQNPNLTPAQRAAVQQMLNAKNRAAAQVAQAGGTPAQQAAAAKAAGAVPASPLQSASLVMPLLIGAGVVAAWGLAHHGKVQEIYTAARRRVRRVLS